VWFAIGTLSRWLVFLGVLLMVGSLVFVSVVARPGRGGGEDDSLLEPDCFLPRFVAAKTAYAASLLLLLGALGRISAQLAVFRDPFEPLGSELALLLEATTWGKAWMAQVALGLTAALLFARVARALARGRGVGPTWCAAAIASAGLAFVPAFSGHAFGTQDLRVLAVASDGVHVLAASAWLGTLAVIARVTVVSRRRGAAVGRPRLVSWIARFSPLALGCAAVTVASGVFAAWLHLDAVSSLWLSTYGRRLLLKMGVLSVIIGLGAYNWKRSRGRIEAAGDPARLPGTVAWELAAALGILLVTALLVDTPMPME
jgi:putative copper export protein